MAKKGDPFLGGGMIIDVAATEAELSIHKPQEACLTERGHQLVFGPPTKHFFQ